LVVIGFFAKIFFFFKIKWIWFRLGLITTLGLNCWFLILIYDDLEFVFFEGTSLQTTKLIIKGWEKYHIVKIFDEIKVDILFYYLYCHRKIINKNYTLSIKGMFKGPENLHMTKYMLIFFAFLFLSSMIFIESLVKSESLLIEFVKELKRD
jgi:hypothetical protein